MEKMEKMEKMEMEQKHEINRNSKWLNKII